MHDIISRLHDKHQIYYQQIVTQELWVTFIGATELSIGKTVDPTVQDQKRCSAYTFSFISGDKKNNYS